MGLAVFMKDRLGGVEEMLAGRREAWGAVGKVQGPGGGGDERLEGDARKEEGEWKIESGCRRGG